MMSDLIKRLGDPNRDWPEFGHDRREAKDRIEELVKELQETQDRANAFATKEYYTEMRAERAEAKLAKAVEALRETTQMLSQCTFTTIRMGGQYFDRHEVVDKANAVLAELEGK